MKTSRTRYRLLTAGLIIVASSLSGQTCPKSRLASTKAAVDHIRADDIQRDVSYLASDAKMGRRTPFLGVASPGYDSAAAYVARFLANAHVKPMGDNGTYFQHYTVTRSTLDTTKVAGTIGGAAPNVRRVFRRSQLSGWRRPRSERYLHWQRR